MPVLPPLASPGDEGIAGPPSYPVARLPDVVVGFIRGSPSHSAAPIPELLGSPKPAPQPTFGSNPPTGFLPVITAANGSNWLSRIADRSAREGTGLGGLHFCSLSKHLCSNYGHTLRWTGETPHLASMYGIYLIFAGYGTLTPSIGKEIQLKKC